MGLHEIANLLRSKLLMVLYCKLLSLDVSALW